MPTFLFTKNVKKAFSKLDPNTQKRIIQKLTELKKDNDFRSILRLHDALPATHRLRIGDFRLILQQKENSSFLVIDIGHRSSIYK